MADVGLLSARQKARLRELSVLLRSYSFERDTLEAFHAGTAELLDTDKFILYGVRPRGAGDDLMVDWGFSTSSYRVMPLLDTWLVGKGISYAGYNPLRPEPWQRNRVLSTSEIIAVTGGPSPVETSFYPTVGARGHDSLRVLLSERSSLVGYAGLIQPGASTPPQRAVLRRLVAPLRRRLVFERWIREAQLAVSALDVVLEHVGAAAWVLDRRGAITHANTAGRERRTATRSFDDELRGGGARSSLERVALGDSGTLVIERRGEDIGIERGQAFAARVGLTPAQARILGLVVRGYTNATIAAELGVAERTVETHMTAIFEKAQVVSRAALISAVFRGER